MKPVHPPSRSSGYTILEMLIVLVIIGVLAAVGISSLGAKSPRAVKSSLVSLKAALHEARQHALASGRTIQLQMTYDNDRKFNMTAVDDATSIRMQFQMDPSFLSKATLAKDTAGLPDQSVKNLAAAATYGFDSGSPGWNTNPIVSQSVGFTSTGEVALVTNNAGVLSTTPLPNGFWMGVVGKSINQTGVPYGVILVSGRGQIIIFYKGDSMLDDTPDHKWQRLE